MSEVESDDSIHGEDQIVDLTGEGFQEGLEYHRQQHRTYLLLFTCHGGVDRAVSQSFQPPLMSISPSPTIDNQTSC